MQAYDVNSAAIRCGCAQNYEKFYEIELPQRKEVFFPPFCRLVKLIFTSTKEEKAKSFAKEIRKAFRSEIAKNSTTRHEIFGPIPAAIAKFREEYRFVLLIKSSDLQIIRNFILNHDLHKKNDVIIDIDPITTD